MLRMSTAFLIALFVMCIGVVLHAAPGDTLLDSQFKEPSDANWTPLSGKWFYNEDTYCETTDGGGPLWSVAGKPGWANYSVTCAMKALDGAGTLHVAGRWQDDDDYYEMRYVGRGHFIEINKVFAGVVTTLSRRTDVLDIGGGKQPYGVFRFELSGPVLKVFINDKLSLQAVDHTFKSGRIALGVKERRGVWDFVKVTEIASPSEEQIALQSPVLTLKTPRTSFIRPKAEVMKFTLENRSDRPMKNIDVSIRLLGVFGMTHHYAVIDANGEVAFELPLDTRLIKSGDYNVKIEVLREGVPIQQSFIPIHIQPTPNPHRMEVINWTGVDPGIETHGFTATWFTPKVTPDNARLGLPIPVDADDPVDIAQSFESYNNQLALNLLSGFNFHNLDARRLKIPDGVNIMSADFEGKPVSSVNPNHPLFQQWADAWIKAVMESYEGFDGLRFVDINTEWDRELDYSPETVALYMKEFGRQPPRVKAFPVDRKIIPAANLPKNGVISDDNPYYTYFLWWWKTGQGYTTHNDRMHDIIKSYRPDILTINEPVLRIPSIYGKAGKCDVAQHWSYAWPTPRSILISMDQLVAVKKFTGQKISHDVQILWKDNWAAADITNPSPDIIRECLWMNMSRPSDLTFTWGTFLAIQDEKDPKASVHPDVYAELKRFHETVTQPFGPMIRKTTSPHKPVAFLTSTASYVFLKGWRYGPEIHSMNFYDLLQAANIPTDTVWEADVKAGALAKRGYKVVVLSYCETLPKSVYDQLVAFQRAGGKIVCDQYTGVDLPGAVKMNMDLEFLRMLNYNMVNKQNKPGVDEVEKQMDGLVATIRKTFAGLYEPEVRISADKVLYNRIDGNGVPVFTFINDLRTKGEWAGQYNTVYDAGMPQTAEISIRVGSGDAVLYNLNEHCKVDARLRDGWATFNKTFGPGEGMYIVQYPKPIEQVQVTATPGESKTQPVTVEVLVLGPQHQPMPGLQPLKIDILNGAGVPTEYSLYDCAENGRLSFSFQPAVNEVGGAWTVAVTDLTAGLRSKTFVHIPRDRSLFKEVTAPENRPFDLERWDRD